MAESMLYLNFRTIKKMAQIFSCIVVLCSQASLAQVIQFSSSTGINFGMIEFASSHMGELTLGTNGAVSLTGTGLSYQGNAVPGQIAITGDAGVIEIRCSATATLGSSGGALSITEIETSLNTGVPIGSGDACAGVNGAAVMVLDLSATPDPRILFGGKLEIPFGGLSNADNFNTSGSGGNAIVIRAIYL